MALNLEAIGQKIGPLSRDYTWKEVVLYALGVGAGFEELDYVYENRLKVLPSFAIAAIYNFLVEAALKSNADLTGVLHGEQDMLFHSPIPAEGTLTTEGAVTHLYDKGEGKGALVVAEADTLHSNGRKLFTNVFTLFCRRDGGFGGEPGPSESVEFPERAPDFEEPASPSVDQPLLYRLSGDLFGLHVDPQFAKASGFEMPIMHGLCTHGYACRAVIRHLFPGEPERMRRFRVRFSRTLYPGIPITTQIWKMEEGLALFRTLNAQNGEVVIDRGVVEWLGRAEMERRARLGAIHFDDRVAIVTGAGAGLGRAYALELAKRGAKVVVNDLGGGRDGRGGSRGAADEVVAEIKALGGEAVASYDSVASPEGGEAIVARALEAFGRVDILINNAGILRDKTLVKMEAGNWDGVLDVHLKGAYSVTRPAFVKMREQGYGRIVLTSSAAGLYGNFGQTNYSAAKLGLVGFMNTLKLEGEKHGIKVNTVAPVAATRLTEDIFPPEMLEKLKPEFVAPLVLYLSSEQCPVTGGIYNAGMGYFSRAGVVTGPGTVIGDGVAIPTPEAVAAAMAEIKSLSDAREYPNATAAFAPMLEALSGRKKGAGREAQGAGKDGAGGGLTVQGIFEQLPQAFRPEKAAGVEVVFQFAISGPQGGEWAVAIREGRCAVEAGKAQRADTTIRMADKDFVGLIRGELNAMSAFTGGKLKIEGDLMKSQLIEKLFKF